MLKRLSFACALAVLILAGSFQTALAQGPYALADYLFMPPGGWKLMLEGDWLTRHEYAYYGELVLDNQYEWDGGEWWYVYSPVWRITSLVVMYLGDVDEGGAWPVSPPHRYPASLPVGQLVSGVSQEVGQPVYEIWRTIITQDGLTITTPAGVFSNCLKVRWANMSIDFSSGSYSIGIADMYHAADLGAVSGTAMIYDSHWGWLGPFNIEIQDYSLVP